MPSDIQTKICGLTTVADMDAALDAGAHYVGLVFFAKSPRHVDMETARILADRVPSSVTFVALTVNPDDAMLRALVDAVPLGMLQLHGKESPERVAEIRSQFGLPVMKAIGVASEADLDKIDTYADVADQLLIDAKPPKSADLPGGNGLAFDWRLLSGVRDWPLPWMLAGGLEPGNVGDAIALTGATQVDVSTGVESAPGRKDPARMAAFIRATHSRNAA